MISEEPSTRKTTSAKKASAGTMLSLCPNFWNDSSIICEHPSFATLVSKFSE
jgi:hypothetical protein